MDINNPYLGDNLSHLKILCKMKRAEINKIADAHIEAKLSGNFDDVAIVVAKDVFDTLKQGKTNSHVMHEVEVRYATITSCIYSSTFKHATNAYKASIRRGFQTLLKEQ